MKSSKDQSKTNQTINHNNMYDHASKEFYKWSADGKWIYLKHVFENGQILFSRFDINDPSEKAIPITRRAYTAVKCKESERY